MRLWAPPCAFFAAVAWGSPRSAAVSNLAHADVQVRRSLPQPGASAAPAALADSLRESGAFTRSWEEIERRLADVESAAGAGGLARVVRSDATEARTESIVANSRGAFASREGEFASVSISTAAADGADAQVGEGWRGARRFDSLDWVGAGAEAARRATAIIGARPIRTGRRTVMFAPWVAAEFMETICALLSAEEVQKGRSLLAAKIGERLGSPLLTLRDDPHRIAGWASGLFDDEGVPTRGQSLLDRGILSSLFDDCATAARAGRAPNGCGYRDGFESLPKPGPSNFFLESGAVSPERLISDTRDGLFVFEVLGMHMIDPATGEFSVGVSGREIRGGAVAGAFKGAMIAGNLVDLLGRIDGVADDLTFYGGLGSPTFRVGDLDAS